MLGSILGDIAGSVYEFTPHKSLEIPLPVPGGFFTDDSVLSVATASVLLDGGNYASAYRQWGRRYPNAGFGGMFRDWLQSDDQGPYNSFGNGSAMRVGPVGWAFDSLEDTLREAEHSAAATHNHPEGIKGAQATAMAIYLARTGSGKDEIREALARQFPSYDLNRRTDDIRPSYQFDVTCQGSVPEALICFLESRDFEETLRLSISLGGDADTQACIAGSIAEAYYGGVPDELARDAESKLDNPLGEVTQRFREQYVLPRLSPKG